MEICHTVNTQARLAIQAPVLLLIIISSKKIKLILIIYLKKLKNMMTMNIQNSNKSIVFRYQYALIQSNVEEMVMRIIIVQTKLLNQLKIITKRGDSINRMTIHIINKENNRIRQIKIIKFRLMNIINNLEIFLIFKKKKTIIIISIVD